MRGDRASGFLWGAAVGAAIAAFVSVLVEPNDPSLAMIHVNRCLAAVAFVALVAVWAFEWGLSHARKVKP